MDQEEALKQIKIIRQMMSRATDKFFFSPWQWIEWALLIIIGCVLTIWCPAVMCKMPLLFLWVIIFIVGGSLETLIWMRAAQNRGVEPFNPLIMRIWGMAGCIMFIAIILSLVFIQIHQPFYIPGLWMLSMGVTLYSCVILGGRKRLLIIGTILLVCGLTALSFLVVYSLYVLMAGFGLGGLLYGVWQLYADRKANILKGENDD